MHVDLQAGCMVVIVLETAFLLEGGFKASLRVVKMLAGRVCS